MPFERRGRTSKRLIPNPPKIVHQIPTKLPPEVCDYKEIYGFLLKHGFKGGRVKGNLIEVGPFFGGFLQFLCTTPGFRFNPHFSVAGIEPQRMAVSGMPLEARSRTINTSMQAFAEGYEKGKRPNIDLVIAKDVFNSPRLAKGERQKLLESIAAVTVKGGKVFLQTEKPEQMPTREDIRKNGFIVIDSLNESAELTFVLVLKKVHNH